MDVARLDILREIVTTKKIRSPAGTWVCERYISKTKTKKPTD